MTTLALRSHLYAQLDGRLDDVGKRASGAFAPPGRGKGPGMPDGAHAPPGIELDQFVALGPQPQYTVVAVVKDGTATEGKVGRKSKSAPYTSAQDLDAGQLAALGTVPADDHPHTLGLPGLGSYRVRYVTGPNGSFCVGIPTEDTDGIVNTLIVVEVCVTAAGLLAACLAGTVIVGVATRPLRRVAATATPVSELPLHTGEVNLSERVPDAECDPHTEVGQVGAALNRMLDHVHGALQARQRSETRARQFVADAVRALEDGRTGWLVWAGAAICLAFLAKTLQAFLILPPLALVYTVCAPVPLKKRLGQLAAATAALVVSGGWWVAVVELWLASSRPYIGGSQHNSFLELTFGYNGFGRLNGEETGSVGGGGAPGGGGGGMWGSTGWDLMFGSEVGGQWPTAGSTTSSRAAWAGARTASGEVAAAAPARRSAPGSSAPSRRCPWARPPSTISPSARRAERKRRSGSASGCRTRTGVTARGRPGPRPRAATAPGSRAAGPSGALTGRRQRKVCRWRSRRGGRRGTACGCGRSRGAADAPGSPPDWTGSGSPRYPYGCWTPRAWPGSPCGAWPAS
ncbi:glycosyltransferase family 39 protein [Streptomyces misionensis]|uniref:glycosyltransferase family 39 protein n=1 Tax=Streptomyces misionensis TaxID=67331 RepID=UPI003685DAE0